MAARAARQRRDACYDEAVVCLLFFLHPPQNRRIINCIFLFLTKESRTCFFFSFFKLCAYVYVGHGSACSNRVFFFFYLFNFKFSPQKKSVLHAWYHQEVYYSLFRLKYFPNCDAGRFSTQTIVGNWSFLFTPRPRCSSLIWAIGFFMRYKLEAVVFSPKSDLTG